MNSRFSKLCVVLCMLNMLISCDSSPKINENNLSKSGWYGNIKIVTHINNISKDTSKSCFNENGFLTARHRGHKSKVTYQYDDNGNLIEEITYNSDAIFKTKTYLYDDKGHNVEYQIKRSFDGEIYRVLFRYDDNGKLLQETVMSTSFYENKTLYNQTVTYRYDSRWNLVEKIEHRGISTYECSIYTYDNNDNLVEKVRYKNSEPSDDNFDEKTTYKYSNTGKLIEKVEFDGYQYDKYTYQYDKMGKIIEQTEYRSDDDDFGESDIHVTVKYEYDSFGNWTKKTRTLDDRAPEITEQIIEYY